MPYTKFEITPSTGSGDNCGKNLDEWTDGQAEGQTR